MVVITTTRNRLAASTSPMRSSAILGVGEKNCGSTSPHDLSHENSCPTRDAVERASRRSLSVLCHHQGKHVRQPRACMHAPMRTALLPPIELSRQIQPLQTLTSRCSVPAA
jgi:hypothetical protein